MQSIVAKEMMREVEILNVIGYKTYDNSIEIARNHLDISKDDFVKLATRLESLHHEYKSKNAILPVSEASYSTAHIIHK